MNLQNVEYLIRLATGGFYKKKMFRQQFNHYIKTGDDLLELLYYLFKKRGGGQVVKKAVLSWIYTHDPFFVEKELSKNYKNYDGLTILKLFHPKPINKSYQKAFQNIKANCIKKRN